MNELMTRVFENEEFGQVRTISRGSCQQMCAGRYRLRIPEMLSSG